MSSTFNYGVGQFELREKGVYYLGRDPRRQPQAAAAAMWRLNILAQTRDDKSESWGRLLEWRDNDKVPHIWAMPNELLQSDGAAGGAIRTRTAWTCHRAGKTRT